MTELLYLSTDDLRGLAEPSEFVEAVRDGYRQIGEGAPAEPRTALHAEDPSGMLTSYVAILPDTGAMGGYTYSAGFGAGDAFFLTPLFDARSGEPLAVLDGAWFNPFKTGATGAVGLDALARDDAERLALIGSGRQARGQLVAAATVRDWNTVTVFSPTRSHRESFAAEFDAELEADVRAAESAAAAIADVHAVITATRSSNPVFDGDDLPDGAHVTAIGQYHPERRELDEGTVARATYVPDLRARVTRDAGSFIQALDAGAIDENHVHAELGEVLNGTASGRTGAEEVTVFDSGGTAIETVAAAKVLYDRAVERNRGTPIDISPGSEAMPGGFD
ncbi:MAG: ornithine cyclodeaminase family protein [Halobacteriales archaeon]